MADSRPVAVGPQLEWGLLGSFDLSCATRMATDLTRVWQVAQISLGLVVRPIERFELAGTLNGHPGHIRSDEAKRPFGAIFALAVTSRTAAEPLRSESLHTAGCRAAGLGARSEIVTIHPDVSATGVPG